MRKESQLQLYQDFIIHCTANAKSIKNYSDFKRINECLGLLYPDKPHISILDFDDPVEFENVINELSKQKQFIEYDKKGGNQYSNTLKHYLRFLFAKKMFSNTPKNAVIQSVANIPLQQIFYGAPGTGKSHKVNETTEQQPKENVFRTTFHPDSDYSTFVGCYKPTMKPTGVILASKENEEVITYKFVAQAFTKAYVRAWQTTNPVFLVIEEINRGNCAQIFGDLFQLLDRKDGVSEYPVDADTDLANFIRTELDDSSRTDIPAEVKDGQKLLLPANLYIWATMNTSDQSLFPIDSAFKRRWEWKYIPIDTRKENWTIKVDGADYDWSDFLEKINKKIESTTHSEDKMLGFYFCKAENSTINAERFVNKVAFYLWNDVFKDYGFDDAIFNDENGEKLSFHKFYKNDGTVEEAKVKTFLDKLGVTHQGETSVDIGEELQ